MAPPRAKEQFGFDLARLARLWRARLDERLAPLGLTQAKWTILLHLSKADGHLPQRELVERVGVEGPTLVRVLDGLERLGLLERRDCPTDRRSKIIHLTSAATPLIGEIATIAAILRAEALSEIDDAELELCQSLIARMTRNLGGGRTSDGESL
ncbi:transcriptional regulator SlyA [Magnetospirillum fulvum]|uniref:MarR family transcriptional regulator n=1 Tax=Magnetospirillum fulvum MGU-K5 TaxID=1316936 RepID=S9TVI5_MAGFU|nr:transcriptional regulator SlyA [Magnetospirillum fulvum]EPY02460.1 MarR family transcriptional regulator [Magnetospirillum fulvum MGU-K5]